MTKWTKPIEFEDGKKPHSGPSPVEEREMLGRGVRFGFLVRPPIEDDKMDEWDAALWEGSGMSEWFERPEITYDMSEEKDREGWMVVKVRFTKAKFVIRPSEAENFYRQVCRKYMDWVGENCRSRKMECEALPFNIYQEIFPPENPWEILPMSALGGLVKK